MRRLFYCIAMWLAGFGLAWAEGFPALYDVAGVAANDVLNLRAKADARSEKRGELAHDAQSVEVTELSPDGRWGLVAQAEQSSWAAMRFLVRMPGPDWDALQTPLNCFGTEPFWSLSIDPAAGKIDFRGMDQPEIGLRADWSANAAGQRGVVGMAVAGLAQSGFLTLKGQACSDGMSDRMFGISLSLFLRGDAGAVGYGGCCTLSR